ncbi:MAG: hypothetical protein ACOYOJ_00570, partial [Alsobacter sp.]
MTVQSTTADRPVRSARRSTEAAFESALTRAQVGPEPRPQPPAGQAKRAAGQRASPASAPASEPETTRTIKSAPAAAPAAAVPVATALAAAGPAAASPSPVRPKPAPAPFSEAQLKAVGERTGKGFAALLEQEPDGSPGRILHRLMAARAIAGTGEFKGKVDTDRLDRDTAALTANPRIQSLLERARSEATQAVLHKTPVEVGDALRRRLNDPATIAHLRSLPPSDRRAAADAMIAPVAVLVPFAAEKAYRQVATAPAAAGPAAESPSPVRPQPAAAPFTEAQIKAVEERTGKGFAALLEQEPDGSPGRILHRLMAARAIAGTGEFKGKVDTDRLDRDTAALTANPRIQSLLERARSEATQAVLHKTPVEVGDALRRRLNDPATIAHLRSLPPSDRRAAADAMIAPVAVLVPFAAEKAYRQFVGAQLDFSDPSRALRSASPEAVEVAVKSVFDVALTQSRFTAGALHKFGDALKRLSAKQLDAAATALAADLRAGKPLDAASLGKVTGSTHEFLVGANRAGLFGSLEGVIAAVAIVKDL